MLALDCDQPSFPNDQAGRPRPDCPGVGYRVPGVERRPSAGPPTPLRAQHPSPGFLGFKSGHPDAEALPAVRCCLLENTGKLCRVFPPLSYAQEKLHGNCQRRKPSMAPRNPRRPASPPLRAPPPSPGRLLCWGREEGGRESFLSNEAHTSSEATFRRRLSGESWATNTFTDRITAPGMDWKWTCQGDWDPGPERPEGNAPRRRINQGGLEPFPRLPRGFWGLTRAQGRGTLTSLSARLPRWHQSPTNPNPRQAKINYCWLPQRLWGLGGGGAARKPSGRLRYGR